MTDTHEAGELLDILSIVKNFGGHATAFAMGNPPEGGTCGYTASIFNLSRRTDRLLDFGLP